MQNVEGLDEATLRRYVSNGYIHVQPVMPTGFHQDLYRQIDEVFETEGNPGNNLLPRVPAIGGILDDTQVRGALTSILGEDYIVHAHRHCHFRPPHTDAQRMHKDSWARRHHRTRWAMAFYYPQDTTVDMGPTGVVPGSQYFNDAPDSEAEVALAGEAGTVVIVHYDLWHRGMANVTDRKRYMLKFLFARMDEPEPAKESTQDRIVSNGFEPTDPRSTMWRSMLAWHTGREVANEDLGVADADALSRRLDAPEAEALKAAYALGTGGEAGHDALLNALQSASQDSRRNIGYGLAAASDPVADRLCDLLADAETGVRLAAIDALADAGVGGERATAGLRALLKDDDADIRHRAAYGLGCLGSSGAAALPDLVAALESDDEWLARNASLAIARHGKSAGDFVEQLQRTVAHPNRYVQANALKALQRIDTTASRTALIVALQTSRWCPITTPKTPY